MSGWARPNRRRFDCAKGLNAAGRAGAGVDDGPALILAYEPTGNLDSRTGAAILTLLAELAHTDGQRLLVMVTHNSDAAAATDRRITLQDGRVCSNALLVSW